MNISCTKYLVLGVLLLAANSQAQESLEAFSETEFAVRHSFSKSYSTNWDLSTRAYLNQNNDFGYVTRQLQIAHFSSYKLNLKNSIAIGLMYRNRDLFEESSNEIRVTQQFNRKSIFKTLRFGHRFRSEQRFFENFTAFRFRYRLAIDLPLQGLKLDVGETYLVITNEGLLTASKPNKPEIEYRISPAVGILLTEKLILEFGLELRLDEINIETNEILFFNTSVDFRI
ncbi:MAG: DUF2490 domain-containing protein [Bacteroidota bacterium]